MAAKIAEVLTLLFGIAVIIGVVAEYVLSATGWGAVGNWPGAFVALGVAGEVVFAHRGTALTGVVSDRLKGRLADAVRTAAEADRWTEIIRKSLEPRSLDPKVFRESLKNCAPVPFETFFDEAFPDASPFASYIYVALSIAGWPSTHSPRKLPARSGTVMDAAQDFIPRVQLFGAQLSGISVVTRANAANDVLLASQVLSRALSDATSPPQTVGGGRSDSVSQGFVRIIVAPPSPTPMKRADPSKSAG